MTGVQTCALPIWQAADDGNPRARPDALVGVARFVVVADTDDQEIDRYRGTVSLRRKRGRLLLHRDPGLEDLYLTGLSRAVATVLARDGLRPDQIDWVVPPQISQRFLSGLPGAIGIGAERILDLTHRLTDTLTTSMPLTLQSEWGGPRLSPGKKGLLLACGSGITAGAAVYYF